MLAYRRWLWGVFAAGLCGSLIQMPSLSAADAQDNTADFPLAQITWTQSGDLLIPAATDNSGQTLDFPETALDPALGNTYGRGWDAIGNPVVQEEEELGEGGLPKAYSLLDDNGECYITSVKDQGTSGLCWAYSAMGACESNILVQGLAIPEAWKSSSGELDLSEASLSWYIYTKRMQLGDLASGDYVLLDGKGVSGGNATIASFAMAAGIGPQLEQYAPMADWDGGYSEYQRYTSYYEMTSSDIIWSLESGSEDIIKQWILESGAVTASYYSASAYYDNGSSSAYYQTRRDEDDADHAILIVGWDDDYPKENFSSACRPSRDGAWLIRNSWGDDDAYGGYFWMSYDEPSLCELARFQIQEKQDGQTRYQYDGSVAYSGIIASAAANVFTAESNCTLHTVMFPMSSLNASQVQYTISIYQLNDYPQSPEDGTLVSTTSGVATYGGYKSIPLETPVDLIQGDQFSVVLSLSRAQITDRRPYLSLESNIDDTASSRCLIRAGQSYVCDNGGDWYDIYDLRETTDSSGNQAYSHLGNVSLKVLATADPVGSLGTTEAGLTNRSQLEAALAYGAPGADSNSLYRLAYAQALALDDHAPQWEIDNAAANLLAGLEREGLLAYPQYLYRSRRYLLGDVDLDDTVSILDAYQALVTYSRGSVGLLDALLPTQVAAADVDEDGNITIRDAYAILLYYSNQSAGNQISWDVILANNT